MLRAVLKRWQLTTHGNDGNYTRTTQHNTAGVSAVSESISVELGFNFVVFVRYGILALSLRPSATRASTRPTSGLQRFSAIQAFAVFILVDVIYYCTFRA